MPQPVRISPFEELKLRGPLRPQPHPFLHLLRAQFFAESRAMRLWEIHERAGWRHEVLQLREHLSSGGWDESIPRPRDVHQPIPVVVTEIREPMPWGPGKYPPMTIS